MKLAAHRVLVNAFKQNRKGESRKKEDRKSGNGDGEAAALIPGCMSDGIGFINRGDGRRRGEGKACPDIFSLRCGEAV